MIASDLAAAGIILDTDGIIFSKDVRFGKDLSIVGNVTVVGDDTIIGDLQVGGSITSESVGKYYLPFYSHAVGGAANVMYAVVPVGGQGDISNVRWVLTTGQTGAPTDITLLVGVGGDAISPANPVTISVSALGTAGVTSFASTLENIEVVAGDVIVMTSAGNGAAGVINGFIEITRT